MLIVWTNELILAMVYVGILGGAAFFLGTRGRKWLVVIPLLLYFGIAAKPLYQTTVALHPWYELGTFQFDQYSCIVELFPLLWVPVIFMTGYYYKKREKT